MWPVWLLFQKAVLQNKIKHRDGDKSSRLEDQKTYYKITNLRRLCRKYNKYGVPYIDLLQNLTKCKDMIWSLGKFGGNDPSTPLCSSESNKTIF